MSGGFRTVIEVEGLANLNRSLRGISNDAPKALRLALNEAAEHLITETRKEIPVRSGKARASLKAASTRTAVRIRVGGSRAPYYPWLDWGGKTGKNKTAKRPFFREGRYLYPTLAKNREKIEQILERALGRLVSDNGLDAD